MSLLICFEYKCWGCYIWYQSPGLGSGIELESDKYQIGLG